ncbi:hypothetical protein GCM10009674_00930 [Nesterenkonia xinjiangensis]
MISDGTQPMSPPKWDSVAQRRSSDGVSGSAASEDPSTRSEWLESGGPEVAGRRCPDRWGPSECGCRECGGSDCGTVPLSDARGMKDPRRGGRRSGRHSTVRAWTLTGGDTPFRR